MLDRREHLVGREAGEDLALAERSIALVRQGVLATWAEHPSGDAGLLDLAGTGHLVTGHGTDLCHIRHHALTDVLVEELVWEQALASAEVAGALRDQLHWREAWAAAMAHSHTEDQLFELLALLAARFGVVAGSWVRIDVALTHGLLAAATGRTRPTVTRALQRLRRAGQLTIAGSGPAQRYLLPIAALDSAVRHRP